MKSRRFSPHHHGWIESVLDKQHIDFLWERIGKGSEEDTKGNLAGNISKSYKIEDDEDRYFFNELLKLFFQIYVRILMYFQFQLTLYPLV